MMNLCKDLFTEMAEATDFSCGCLFKRIAPILLFICGWFDVSNCLLVARELLTAESESCHYGF